MKLLPLGSIIKVNGHKVCIIGYGTAKKEAEATCGYFVVSYPVGFTNIDKMFFVPGTKEYELIACGYKTVSSEKMLDLVADSFEKVKKFSESELLTVAEAIRKTAKKEAGES